MFVLSASQNRFIVTIQLCLICVYFQLASCTKVNDLAPADSSSDKTSEAIVKPSTKPNIILVLGDDIGYEVPTYTGGQSYATPNIDALAQRGMQFTNCYGMPKCSPSRFELMTGKYNNRNYTADLWGHLDLSQKTIANMLHDAGYKTCIAGKWQLDGGDTSIHVFGFDTYSVTSPYKVIEGEYEEGDLSLYKNPRIYQYGDYLPDSYTKNKYGEDINRDFLFSFIDSNKNKSKPFFAMWTPNLCHAPFSPTPDDPEFAAWNPDKQGSRGDTAFFPSMVKYFDKEVGMLITKLQSANIASNTIILFVVGDNGTDRGITSQYKGAAFRGGKGFTFMAGIHVPMIAYCPGVIKAKQVNTNIVDFTDILPTLAGLAKIKTPTNYGVLDGLSFAPQLSGQAYTARTASFGYYDNDRIEGYTIPPSIYAFDYTYKLYEDTSNRLYNYITDTPEKKPIAQEKMTAAQKKADSTLDAVIKHYMQ